MRKDSKTYLNLSVPSAEKKTSSNLLSSFIEAQVGIEKYVPEWKPDCLGQGIPSTRCGHCHSRYECFQLFGGD
jgi:hypothetical protein